MIEISFLTLLVQSFSPARCKGFTPGLYVTLSLESPAATIGHTMASFHTRKSISTGRSLISLGLLDAFDGLVLGERAHADAAVRFGELHEVRHVHDVRRVLAVQQVRRGIVAIVEQGLPLTDHAVHGVLSSAIFTGVWSRNAAGQLFGGHLEGAVAVDEPHRLLVVEFAGGADAAPMAAGRPKPIVPRPPEDSQEWGLLNSMIWVAHI